MSLVDTTIGSPPDESVVSQIDKIIFTKRGKIVNELENPLIMVAGTKISGTPPSASLTSESFTIALSLTNRAPVSLLDPNNSAVPLALSGWGNTDPYLQRRYFLLGQELLLGEPWNFSEVGIFVIDELFSTLRFNGLQWNY